MILAVYSRCLFCQLKGTRPAILDHVMDVHGVSSAKAAEYLILVADGDEQGQDA